jgi:ribonuclease-3
LQRVLGVSLKDSALLQLALVHSSYINENPDFARGSNERLEFLGDAVLGFIVSEKLFHDFPDFSEGDMTKRRSVLVRGDTLARVAENIKLGGFLYLGKGEETSGGRYKPANLAGALEAVIAAVFLDRGLATTRKFVLSLLKEEMVGIVEQNMRPDYKSRLQEFAQSRYQSPPQYRLADATGPDHDRLFTVEVRIDSAMWGRGSGKSKKSAETEAARQALERLSADFTP